MSIFLLPFAAVNRTGQAISWSLSINAPFGFTTNVPAASCIIPPIILPIASGQFLIPENLFSPG